MSVVPDGRPQHIIPSTHPRHFILPFYSKWGLEAVVLCEVTELLLCYHR